MQERWSDIFKMDEELKKTINTLSVSVKAIQVDLLILKSVTHNDNNLQAGLQYSDLVSGNGPVQKKKISEDESESNGEGGEFELSDTDIELYELLEAVGPLLKQHLS